jgi:hypothetical protein
MEDSENGRKQAFVRQYGDAYGYSGQIDELRKTEFAHVKGKLIRTRRACVSRNCFKFEARTT